MFPSDFNHHIALDPAFMRKWLPEVHKDAREKKKQFKADTLVGCGFGSIPWVIRLSTRMRLPYVLVRKPTEKVNASQRHPVVGRLGPKGRCLFVDDTVSTGRTAELVMEELAKFGASVAATLLLRDSIPDFHGAAWAHYSKETQCRQL